MNVARWRFEDIMDNGTASVSAKLSAGARLIQLVGAHPQLQRFRQFTFLPVHHHAKHGGGVSKGVYTATPGRK